MAPLSGHWCVLPSARTQLRMALIVALISLSYPVLRAAEVFPDKFLVELANSVDADRAQSLSVRFEEETILLKHASERFFFGWGRYGRNRVLNEKNQEKTTQLLTANGLSLLARLDSLVF